MKMLSKARYLEGPLWVTNGSQRHERKSTTATGMSAPGGKAEVDFGPLDVSL